MQKPDDIAKIYFGVPYKSLDDRTQQVAHQIAERKHIARNTSKEFDVTITWGQRTADAVEAFGDSWTFLAIFAAILAAWVGLNSFILVNYDKNFDPYPYILLNMFLSMLAVIQAPIILMSQNRQAEKSRINAEYAYDVNLKAELEIMSPHEKVDLLREG